MTDICLNVICDYLQSCDVAGLILQSRVLLSTPQSATVPLLHGAISTKVKHCLFIHVLTLTMGPGFK